MQQLNSTISRQSIQIAHQAKTQIIHMSFDTKRKQNEAKTSNQAKKNCGNNC